MEDKRRSSDAKSRRNTVTETVCVECGSLSVDGDLCSDCKGGGQSMLIGGAGGAVIGVAGSLAGPALPAPVEDDVNMDEVAIQPAVSTASLDEEPNTAFADYYQAAAAAGAVAAGVGVGGAMMGGAVTDELASVASSPASSDSARNSEFCPDGAASSDDETEFKPGGYRRGDPSSRGGRGGSGGKKKPGRGGAAANMKTRSGGSGPSGVFADKLGIGSSNRGADRGSKRGKRGGSKAAGKGGGSRGRGARTAAPNTAGQALQHQRAMSMVQSTLQQIIAAQVQQQQVQQIEQSLSGSLEDDDSRQRAVDEAEYIRTVVVANADDPFLCKSAFCLVCGSIGRHMEGSMVACSNCAQTYHTYCAGLHDKLNSVIIQRGWRCLDCTVCEACGEGNNEQQLLLCEECDTSYHIYCLDPPLDRIPNGQWRCKWCAKCRRCGLRVNGTELTREGLCVQCHSLRKCPKCTRLYMIGDQIIKCSSCSKWYHGRCEDLYNEEMLETAVMNKMRCSQCRPNAGRPGQAYVGGSDSALMICDNVAVNKCAEEVLQSRMQPSMFRQYSDGYGSNYGYNSFDHYGYEDESVIVDEEGGGFLMVSGRGRGGGRGGPGRGRMAKLGVGGFFVKVPRHKLLPSGEEEPVAPSGAEDDGTKKQRKPRKPRRCQLEDAYPAQIQEGFFGVPAVDGKQLADAVVDEPRLSEWTKGAGGQVREMTHGGGQLSLEATEALQNDLNESEVLENVDLGDIDIDNMDLDFSTWMDDDEDDDFGDSLNDAMGVASADGFTPSGENSQDSVKTEAATRFNQSVGGAGLTGGQGPTAPAAHPQHMVQQQQPQHQQLQQARAASVASISRSSSGMDERGASAAQERFRWEEDEPLGHQATKAAVLHANVCHAYLKQQYPEWNERVKHIHRLWRGLGAESRQEFVNRARENRANRVKPPKPKKIATPTQSVDSPGPSGAGGAGGQPLPATTVGQQLAQQMQQYRQGMMSPMEEKFKVPIMPQQQQQPGAPPQMTAGQMAAQQMLARPVYPGGQPMPMGGEEMRVAVGMPAHPAQSPLPSPAPMGGAPMGGPAQLPQPPLDPHLLVNLQNMHLARMAGRDLQMQFDGMRQRTSELTSSQEVIENDLNRMRKQKKNLAAKKRQMIKTAGTDAEGRPLSADLNEEDRATLEGLVGGIPARQKELENCKRDLKQHLATVFDFEQKHQITSEHMAAAHHRHMLARQAAAGGGAPGGGMGPMMHPMHRMQPPQQVIYGQMTGCPVPNRPWARAPVLGGVPLARLPSREDRDVYECLDDAIAQVALRLDGPAPMVQPHQRMPLSSVGESGMLKRLLDPGAGVAHTVGPAQFMDQLAEPPKMKKKRAQPKKATGAGSNEYEQMVERINQQLRLCERLSKRAIEPAPRNDGAAFAVMGISDLPERVDKRALVGDTLGSLRLSFMRDVLEAWKTKPEELLPPMIGMEQIAPHTMVQQLATVSGPSSAPELVIDDEDRAAWKYDVMRQLTGQAAASRDRRECWRVSVRPPPMEREPGAGPSAPSAHPEMVGRMVWKADMTEEEEVEVEMWLKTSWPEEQGEEEKEERLTRIQGEVEDAMGVKGKVKIEYTIDTPPDSPAAAAEEVGSEPAVSATPTPGVLVKTEPPEEAARHTTPAKSAGACRMCSRVMETPLVRQSLTQLGLAVGGVETEVGFCSMKCYYVFVSRAGVALSPDQLVAAEAHVDEETLARLRQTSAEHFARSMTQPRVQSMHAGPPILAEALLTSPRVTGEEAGAATVKKESVHILRVSSLATRLDASQQREPRQPGEGWKVFRQADLESFLRVQAIKQELSVCQHMGVERVVDEDRRVCVLCGGVGDGEPALNGRLLNMDAGMWVHVNCALWSSEVYESPSGGLLHVDRAVVRAAQVLCHLCGRLGASIKCYKTDCNTNFHLHCARRIGGRFVRDRTFICTKHSDVAGDVLVNSLDALRRIYIERNENDLLAKLFDIGDGPKLGAWIGALAFHQIGQLLPDQLKAFHTKDHIFPIGFRTSRWFWSPLDPRRRVLFDCIIREKDGRPEFQVGFAGKHIAGHSPTEAWSVIVGAVEQQRSKIDLLRFFGSHVSGEALFGLSESAISKITESVGFAALSAANKSLPGVDQLFTYSFRHGGQPLMDLPLAENPSGCARCEPRFRTNIKHKSRPIISASGGGGSSGGGASRERQSTSQSTSGVEQALGGGSGGKRGGEKSTLHQELIAAQMKQMAGGGLEWGSWGRLEAFANNQQSYSAYQKMRKEWRQTVYLARSQIQGLGLYAKRDIDMNSMIIEYKGEVIRNEVAEMREKRYNAQNRGVYMFRIDDESLVDATMAGGPARYVNHSCDPNCSTRILTAGTGMEDKKIIITANRPIKAGEELTYDYQFELEDGDDKLACLCGAPNCQKWMN